MKNLQKWLLTLTMILTLGFTQVSADTYSDCTVLPISNPQEQSFLTTCILPYMGEDGLNGITPYIGDNGNWYLGEIDTGVSAQGENGTDGADGAKGDKGDKGDRGVAGKDGAGVEDFEQFTNELNEYRVNLAEYQIKLDDTFQYTADSAAGAQATGAIDFGNVGEGQTEVGVGFGTSGGSYGSDTIRGYAGGLGVKHGLTNEDAIIAKGWYAGHGNYGLGAAVTHRY